MEDDFKKIEKWFEKQKRNDATIEAYAEGYVEGYINGLLDKTKSLKNKDKKKL